MRQPAPTQTDSTEASRSTAHNLKPAEMLALAAVARCIDLTGLLAAEPAMCRDLQGRKDSYMTPPGTVMQPLTYSGTTELQQPCNKVPV